MELAQSLIMPDWVSGREMGEIGGAVHLVVMVGKANVADITCESEPGYRIGR